MSLHDTVLDIVKEKGPALPAEIVSESSRKTGQQRDMFFIGAVLSELMSSGHVKMSNAKIGGSRVYYVPGQEEKLSKLYDYLNDKEKKAYDLLKEKKVLRSSEQEPVIRVALAQLKDFSKPIDVKLKETETFWKWHLLPIEDAKRMIKEILSSEIKNVSDSKDNLISSKQEQNKEESQFIGNIKSSINNDIDNKNEVKNKETRKEQNDVKPEKIYVEEKKEENKQDNYSSRDRERQASLDDATKNIDDEFLKNSKAFLKSKNVRIISSDVVKKNSECEFVVESDSSLGKIRLYVFAKSKKKVSENELGYAYVRAKNRNLELCFLSDGELTKKAKEMLDDELESILFLSMR